MLVAAAIVCLPTDALIARFASLAETDHISSDRRAQIWQDSIGLVKALSVAECGFGAYESFFYRYKTVAPMNTVDCAHNDYLECLADQGVMALAVMLLFFGRILFAPRGFTPCLSHSPPPDSV